MTEAKAIEIMKEWIKYEKVNKDKINKADELIDVQETIVKALENSIPKEVIEKEIEELKDMKIDGEVFITSVNFAIKILQGILEGK